MALLLLQLPSMASSSSSLTENTLRISPHRHRSLNTPTLKPHSLIPLCLNGLGRRRRRTKRGFVFFAGKEDTELRVSTTDDDEDKQQQEKEQQQEILNPEEQDLEDIRQIQRVLKLLRKNRDMLFSEVKLTITIEDPREVERRRLLGIEDPNTPTREDLADALDDVNEGRIPENRAALRMLAEEMVNWPNLEVEATKKKPSKSLYAKATDTGVDPKVAAKRLKIDWDSAAEIEDNDENEDIDVPSIVGFGALYLVSAFPIIIGVSVVLILFYNSLQPGTEFLEAINSVPGPSDRERACRHVFGSFICDACVWESRFGSRVLTSSSGSVMKKVNACTKQFAKHHASTAFPPLNTNTMSIQVSPSSEALLSNSDQARGEDITFYEEDDDDICISIHCLRDELSSSTNETPRSTADRERQISVDPISLKHSAKPPIGNNNTGGGHRSAVKENYMFPPLAPTKSSKFLSSSLPGSASSSPRSGSALIKNLKKWRNSQGQLAPGPAPPPHAISYLARQRSAAVTPFGDQRTDHQLSHLSRSKSCGEGRTSAPSDEFDLWSKRVDEVKHENEQHRNDEEDDHKSANYYEEEYREESISAVSSTRRKNSMGKNKSNPYGDSFKCGACMFLPGFGKGKPVRSAQSSFASRKKDGRVDEEEVARNVVSRTVSLEKFECGSWSSSLIINDDHRDVDADSMQLYYDLPLELIRSSDDAHSPVATAFVFERDHRKGVLKNSSSSRSSNHDQGRSSHESSRHVRFSTSNPVSQPPASPSCITPRLRKAREDFNAYLEAGA